MDHLRLINDNRWVNFRPPKFPSDEEIKMFGTDVLETVEEKLQELIDRSNQLKKDKETNLQDIHKVINALKLNEFKEWFLTYWVNLLYSEIEYVSLWMKYWVKIYERIKNRPVGVKIHKEGEITDEMVERAKEFPIQNLYEGELRDLGNKFVGICPFHGENTPSFTIFTDDNHYYCFGCNEWGDSIDFKMRTKKISMPEAVRELQL